MVVEQKLLSIHIQWLFILDPDFTLLLLFWLDWVCKAQLWCWLETDSPNPAQTRRFASVQKTVQM